jgi:glycosyltransferase involved in cell wall biosynthesis
MKTGVYISDIIFRTGGTESYTAHIIYALQLLYNYPEISIVSEIYNKKNNCHIEIYERLNTAFGTEIKPDNLKLLLIYANKRNFIGRFLFERRINRISKNFDIFINCSINLFHFSAKKNLVLIHFPPYKKIHSDFIKRYPFFIFSALYQDLKWASSYGLFISNSLYTQKWLNRLWKITPEKNALLYPPVAFVKNYGTKKSNSIMICSRIEPSKEIDLLLKIFLSSKILTKIAELYIVGSVIEEHFGFVKKIREIVKNNTTIVHLVENPVRYEIEKYYNLTKVFWHAKGYSRDENTEPAELEHFGISTVEAMSAGCVPVVINKGGQKEIVQDGKNGFLWDIPEQLAERTIFLLENPDKCTTMSKAAKETITRYSFNEFTKNLDLLLT